MLSNKQGIRFLGKKEDEAKKPNVSMFQRGIG